MLLHGLFWREFVLETGRPNWKKETPPPPGGFPANGKGIGNGHNVSLNYTTVHEEFSADFQKPERLIDFSFWLSRKTENP